MQTILNRIVKLNPNINISYIFINAIQYNDSEKEFTDLIEITLVSQNRYIDGIYAKFTVTTNQQTSNNQSQSSTTTPNHSLVIL